MSEEQNENQTVDAEQDSNHVSEEDEEVLVNEKAEKSKRGCYSIKRKLEVVDFAKKYSKHAASKKFSLDRKMIRRWIDDEEKLRIQAG
jgi:hypothetical protein